MCCWESKIFAGCLVHMPCDCKNRITVQTLGNIVKIEPHPNLASIPNSTTLSQKLSLNTVIRSDHSKRQVWSERDLVFF